MDQIVAMLVGGPQHGAQIILPRDTREYLAAEQATLSWLSDVPASAAMSKLHVTTHRYERHVPLTHPKMRDHWVFQWVGER